MAKRKRATPTSAKKPAPSEEGNAPPVVIAEPLKVKKDKKRPKSYAVVAASDNTQVHGSVLLLTMPTQLSDVVRSWKTVDGARSPARLLILCPMHFCDVRRLA